MENLSKKVAVAALLFAAICLWGMFSLWNRVNDLETQVSRMNGDLSGRLDTIYSRINRLGSDITGQLNQQASLLSSSEVTAVYENGGFLVTVRFTPKVIEAGERVLVQVDDQQVEAQTQDGSVYTATLSIPTQQSISPIISFVSSAGSRQEALSPYSLEELLVLDYESWWGEASQLYLTLGSRSESIAAGAWAQMEPPVLAIVENNADETLVGRVTMTEGSIPQDYESKVMVNGGRTFYADLTSFREQGLSATVYLEISAPNGCTYREQIATFYDNTSNQSSSASSGGGSLYPIWE